MLLEGRQGQLLLFSDNYLKWCLFQFVGFIVCLCGGGAPGMEEEVMLCRYWRCLIVLAMVYLFQINICLGFLLFFSVVEREREKGGGGDRVCKPVSLSKTNQISSESFVWLFYIFWVICSSYPSTLKGQQRRQQICVSMDGCWLAGDITKVEQLLGTVTMTMRHRDSGGKDVDFNNSRHPSRRCFMAGSK